jgi:hypothetical protein
VRVLLVAFAKKLLRLSPALFLLSIAFIALGGFGYYFIMGVKLVKAYEIHYDIALAISDPFNQGWPLPAVYFAVVDVTFAWLFLPSFLGWIISEAQARMDLEREVWITSYPLVWAKVEEIMPTAPHDEKVAEAKRRLDRIVRICLDPNFQRNPRPQPVPTQPPATANPP